MAEIFNAVIFTAGQALAFNVVLPIWYFLMQIFGTI